MVTGNAPTQEKFLALLASIIQQKSRTNVLLPLGEEHYTYERLEEFSNGWAFQVEPCFLDALDTVLTPRMVKKKKIIVWTQGSAFNFAENNRLESSPNFPPRIIQIREAHPAIPASASKDGTRDQGFVHAILYKPNPVGMPKWIAECPITTTQDTFVEFLITGQIKDLSIFD